MNNIHIKTQKIFRRIIEEKRLHHAYIIHGDFGKGTFYLTLAFIRQIIKINGNILELLENPDVHFFFPVANNKNIKSKAVSLDFIDKWKKFIRKNIFTNSESWMKEIQSERKRGIISVNESERIMEIAYKKPYKHEYKIMVFWSAEDMNINLSNKCLKLIEEPPQDTVIIFATKFIYKLLPTLRSRMIPIEVPSLSTEEIVLLAKKQGINPKKARQFYSKSLGNWHILKKIISEDKEQKEFISLFSQWMRNIFKLNKDLRIIDSIYDYTQKLSAFSRTKQKSFLKFVLEKIRLAFYLHYGYRELINEYELKDEGGG